MLPFCGLSMNLTAPGPCIGGTTWYFFWQLAYSTWHNILTAHPHCSMCQDFLPFFLVCRDHILLLIHGWRVVSPSSCHEHRCKNMSESLLLIILDIYLEIKLLDHMVALFLIFWETSTLPQWLHQFTLPPTVHKSSLFSASLPTLLFSVFFFFPIVAVQWVWGGISWYFWLVLPAWQLLLK